MEPQVVARYTIKTEVLQAVIDLLNTLPYRQVAGLISAIQQDAKPVEQEPVKEVQQ